MTMEPKMLTTAQLDTLREKAKWARRQMEASGKSSQLCDDVDSMLSHIDYQQRIIDAFGSRAFDGA